jgi:hypothetical protein
MKTTLTLLACLLLAGCMHSAEELAARDDRVCRARGEPGSDPYYRRKQLLGRLLDVELSIRGILRGFGLKVGQVTRKFAAN